MKTEVQEELDKVEQFFRDKAKYYAQSFKLTKSNRDLDLQLFYNIAVDEIKLKSYNNSAPTIKEN